MVTTLRWVLRSAGYANTTQGIAISLYDPSDKPLIHLLNPVVTGSVNVTADIHRIRFNATNMNGFDGTIDVYVYKNGILLPFKCKNCEPGTATELTQLNLFGGLSRTTSTYTSGCRIYCDFYPTGECSKERHVIFQRYHVSLLK